MGLVMFLIEALNSFKDAELSHEVQWDRVACRERNCEN